MRSDDLESGTVLSYAVDQGGENLTAYDILRTHHGHQVCICRVQTSRDNVICYPVTLRHVTSCWIMFTLCVIMFLYLLLKD